MTKDETGMAKADKLQGEINELKEMAKEYAEDITEEGKCALRKIQEQLREKREEIMEEYGPALEKYKDSGKEMVRNVEAKVAEKPLTSLLLAFGVGIVIGKLFSRHRY